MTDIIKNNLTFSSNSEGKYGAVDSNGNILIPFIYKDIKIDKDLNIYIVSKEHNDGVGVIDLNGKVLLECNYYFPQYSKYSFNEKFKKGYIEIRKDCKNGLVNSNWEIVVPCDYDDIKNLNLDDPDDDTMNKKLEVSIYDDKQKLYGIFDLSNPIKPLIPCVYKSIEIINDKYFKIADTNWNCGIVDNSGRLILPCKYDKIIAINQAGFITVGIRVENWVYKYGVFDSNGNEVIPICYERIDEIDDEGCVVLRKDEKFGMYKIGFGFIIPCQYYCLELFSEGRASICADHKWGFIDINNNIVIPAEYDEVSTFREGLAAVKRKNKWGFIDPSNNLVVSFKYDYARNFRDDLAAVKINDKWGYINKNGQNVINCTYDMVDSFRDGLAMVSIIGYGSVTIDKTGRVIGKWDIDNVSHNYSPRELDNLFYDAFEGEQDAIDEWEQR